MNAIAVMVVLVVAGIATATHAITPNNIVASNILDLLKSTFVSSSKENNMNMLNPSYLTSGENEDEIKNWSKYYQTDESASKEKKRKRVIRKKIYNLQMMRISQLLMLQKFLMEIKVLLLKV